MPFPLQKAIWLADPTPGGIAVDGWNFTHWKTTDEQVTIWWHQGGERRSATFANQEISPSPRGEVTLTSLEGNTHTISMWMRVPVSERYGPLRLDDKDL